MGFEALERGVEFWQLEAEGGGNDIDTKVGKFKIYWRMFDYSGAVMEKGLESGKEQILQDAECLTKYIDFDLWKMGSGLISDFSYLLIILTCTEGYAQSPGVFPNIHFSKLHNIPARYILFFLKWI